VLKCNGKKGDALKFTSYQREKKSTNIADLVAGAMALADIKDSRFANGPRASSLIGNCIRQQWYDLKRYPITDPSQYTSLVYKGVGTYCHELWQAGLVDSGVCGKEGIEVELERDDLDMNGFVDAVTKDGVVLEFKTCGARDMATIKRTGKPRDKDLGQILYYMDRLGKDTGAIWYQKRDNLEWRIITVKLSEHTEALEQFKERAQRLYMAWRVDEVPLGREYSISSTYCKNCLYSTQCWKTDKENA
jgi:hypothetical protein